MNKRRGRKFEDLCIPTIDGTGMKKHELYDVWMNMMQRCYNTNCLRYADYGGRGITVHLPWHSCKTFVEQMGPRPAPGMQLDRIDNEKNYEPGNTRWATPKQNVRNRRMTSKLIYQGQLLPVVEVAEIIGISSQSLRLRLKRGDVDPFRPRHPNRPLPHVKKNHKEQSHG